MTLPSDYQAALDYIFNYVDYERRRSVPYTETAWNLDRARRVLAALGNPHERLRFVHVAGSKGKGSTAANVESILRASGYRTGFYTSPHLHTFRERIRIDGQLIDRADVVRLLAECQSAVEAVPGYHHVRDHHRAGAAALCPAAGRLGGAGGGARRPAGRNERRHTGRQRDHTDQLRAHRTARQHPRSDCSREGRDHQARRAGGRRAPARRGLGRDPGRGGSAGGTSHLGRPRLDLAKRCRHARRPGLRHRTYRRSRASPFAEISVPALGRTFSSLHTPLLGTHQLANATVAVATCWELAQQGVAISEDGIRQGLAGVVWPGRLEVLGGAGQGDSISSAGPTVVVDSAHNDASARLLRTALAHYFPGRPVVAILGVSNDKDAQAILSELLPGVAWACFTRSRHPRAADPQELLPIAAQIIDARTPGGCRQRCRGVGLGRGPGSACRCDLPDRLAVHCRRRP